MLQVNRGTDYALRLMLEVGASTDRTTTIAEVAKRQQIPREFLRKIVQTLVSNGLLVSERGARGGVALARPAEEITVLDIIHVFGRITLNHCTADPPRCDRRSRCAIHPVWTEAQAQVERVLGGTRLSELIERHAMLDQPQSARRASHQTDLEGLGVTA